MSGPGYPSKEYQANVRGQSGKKILIFESWNVVPFQGTAKSIINGAFKDLNDILIIDFKKKKGDYSCAFRKSFEWNEGTTKNGYIYRPMAFGMTPPTVFIDALKKVNLCNDMNDKKTCINRYLNTAESLGKAIANTAVHEIGHMFGLTSANYRGANSGGHIGDASNFMYAYELIPDYGKWPVYQYTIKDGESFADIAARRSISLDKLKNIKSPDNRTNRELLMEGNVIWMRDLQKITDWYRKIDTSKKSFTAEQIKIMRNSIISGEDEMTIE